MNTHVIKIGGENASDLRTAEWLADFQNASNKVAVAISALRTKPLNTTTELMKARDAFNKEGMSVALPILEGLFHVHLDTLKDAGMHDGELEDKIRALFTSYFPRDLEFPEAYLKQHPDHAREQRFVGYGEVMSAHVLSHLLDTRFQVANSLIDHSIRVAEEDDRNLSTLLRDDVGQRVHAGLRSEIVIVPGYVSVSGYSIVDAYGRGYTDKTAERVAVGLAHLGHNPILHIQKQVPMLSSNPNNISNSAPIENMSYWTSAEITGARGANAQVLNEHTISPELARHNIPVWVYNPFEENAPKSIISKAGNSSSGILFVDGRDHVSTITISGFAMSGEGLIRKIGQLFATRKLSIDIISSSETEVTFGAYGKLTDDEMQSLGKAIESLLGEDFGVEVKNNLGLVYCIGDNLSGHPGLLSKVTGIVGDNGIDIECASQSRGQRAVTIGVHSENLKKSVALLHLHLIENKN